MILDHDGAKKTANAELYISPLIYDYKYGTVGAMALDKHGNLAAGTSTGRMTNKRYGRLGDSPVIGAGTYANNKSVAVSATGTGEMFIRTPAAYNVHARYIYQNADVKKAGEDVMKEIGEIDGMGGMRCGTVGPEGISLMAMFEQTMSTTSKLSHLTFSR